MREFVDPGASARDDKRPEVCSAMMDAACTDPSPFDVVLVHSQSRFFRDTAGYVFLTSAASIKHAVVVGLHDLRILARALRLDFCGDHHRGSGHASNSAENAKHVTRTMLENAPPGLLEWR